MQANGEAVTRPAQLLHEGVRPSIRVARRYQIDGIVRGPLVREHAVAEIAQWVDVHGWRKIGVMESPINGKEGNVEYLLAAQKGPTP